MGSPAKVLAPADVRRLSARAASWRHGDRNKVIVALSFKAGLSLRDCGTRLVDAHPP
jgi:hypothetical protein